MGNGGLSRKGREKEPFLSPDESTSDDGDEYNCCCNKCIRKFISCIWKLICCIWELICGRQSYKRKRYSVSLSRDRSYDDGDEYNCCCNKYIWKFVCGIWKLICGRQSNNRKRYSVSSSSYGSQADTQQYRNRYPNKVDNPELNDNFLFYINQIPCRPDGVFIDEIHKNWWGQYDKLESNHSYIQWLFPIREQGVNFEAQELQLHEAERICQNPVSKKRVLTSYQLMLDFYGMKLKDETTGEIERSDNWKERFDHLNHSSHNYLRITRILKCLGEMNYEHLKAPFLRFVLHEAIVEGTLDRTLDSCMNYWVEVLRDDQEREDIKKLAHKLHDPTIEETSM